MALLATQTPIKAAAVIGGFDIPHRSDLQEAATQTYLVGAPLVLSSGNLTEATSPGPTGIVGFSENPGQNLSTAGFYNGGVTVNGILVPFVGSPVQGPLYVPALPGVLFEANLAGTTAGDPDQTHALAITDIGTANYLAKSATNKYWYLSTNAGSGSKTAVVIGLKDPVGTVGGRVYFMMLLTTTFTIYA